MQSVRQLRDATIEELLGEMFSLRFVPGCSFSKIIIIKYFSKSIIYCSGSVDDSFVEAGAGDRNLLFFLRILHEHFTSILY
jgi:hypothetical protein